MIDKEKNGWSIQEQLQEQQKQREHKFEVGHVSRSSSYDTVVPT